MDKIFKYQIDDDFGFSAVNIKGVRKYYVEGYASTVVRDKSGEIVDKSAQEDIYNQIRGENITLDLEHSEWYSEDGSILPKPKNTQIPVAKVVDARLDEKGVWIKAELNQNLSKFQELWGSIKDGFLKAFSIAFYPVEKAANNIIKKLNLINITLTGSPVNPEATFSVTMKSASAFLKTHTPQSEADDFSSNIEIKEEITMVEKKPEVKAEVVEEQPKETVQEVEVKAEPVEENTFDAEAEIKALKEELISLKAIKEEVTALKEENVKLKAELDKPVMKATQESIPKVENKAYISPLNLI